MPRELQPCGSYGAYQRHIKHGEPACDACNEAQREYKGRKARVLQPCGTPAARQRHLKHGEPVCETCRAAFNAFQNEYRAARRLRKMQAARAATVAAKGPAA